MGKFISEKFENLHAAVMDTILAKFHEAGKELVTKVVEGGIRWIIGLLNPASAFVKARDADHRSRTALHRAGRTERGARGGNAFSASAQAFSNACADPAYASD